MRRGFAELGIGTFLQTETQICSPPKLKRENHAGNKAA